VQYRRMDNSQSNCASAPPAEEQVPQVEDTAAAGNSSEGNPPGGSAAPLTQVQPHTAQDIAQGDAAIPLETGTRQHNDADRKAAGGRGESAREAALAKLNRERQQKRIRDAQELTRCLNSGMDLLTPEQVRQITCVITGTNNEPLDTLRSFNERLETLVEENPRSGDLKEAAARAVQALIVGAKNAKEQQGKPGTRQTVAVFEVLREALHLPESRTVARQDIPGPLPAGCCVEWNRRSNRCTIRSVASGPTCTR
jgi:hypothetical protein